MSTNSEPTPVQAETGFHDPTSASFTQSFEGRLLFWIAVAFSAFQIATAAHLVDFPSQVVRAFHLGFLTVLVFPLVAAVRGAALPWRLLAWVAAAAGAAVAFYQWWEYAPLLMRAG